MHLATDWHQLIERDELIGAAIIGVVIGTWIGRLLLARVPASAFSAS